MPGRGNYSLIPTPDQLQFADLIHVGYFQSRIYNPNAHPFDLVPDPELVGVLSARAQWRLEIGSPLRLLCLRSAIGNRGRCGFADRRSGSRRIHG